MTDYGMTVYVEQPVKLESKQAQHIFEEVLTKMKLERWTRGGKLMEEHYTSHRFDSVCEDQSDYALVAAIEALQEILKYRKHGAQAKT